MRSSFHSREREREKKTHTSFLEGKKKFVFTKIVRHPTYMARNVLRILMPIQSSAARTCVIGNGNFEENLFLPTIRTFSNVIYHLTHLEYIFQPDCQWYQDLIESDMTIVCELPSLSLYCILCIDIRRINLWQNFDLNTIGMNGWKKNAWHQNKSRFNDEKRIPRK